ncbi:MAG: hypothetical protein ABMA02_04670 [Saprospiraceae bacterium]
MKHTSLLWALLIGLSSGLFAQAPGYLGKRFFVKPEFSSMFALSNPTAGNRGTDTYGGAGDRLGLNTRFGLQIGYALTRRSALTVEASYMNTGMIADAYTPSVQFPDGADYHYLFYNLGGPEVGIAYQTYNPLRGSIAPMGFFTAWRLRMAFLSGKVIEDQISYYNGDSSFGPKPLDTDASYNQFTVGVEFGQNIIVADRLVLSISAELNIPPFNFNFEEEGSSGSDNQSYFDYAAAERMRWHSLFMFKIGAGYLF